LYLSHGKKKLKLNSRYLKLKEMEKQRSVKLEKAKESAPELAKKKAEYIPPADHPWRRHDPSLHHNSYLERV